MLLEMLPFCGRSALDAKRGNRRGSCFHLLESMTYRQRPKHPSGFAPAPALDPPLPNAHVRARGRPLSRGIRDHFRRRAQRRSEGLSLK